MAAGGVAALREKIRSIDAYLTTPLVLPAQPRTARILGLGLAHSGDMPIWIVLLAWKTRAVVTFAGLVLVEIVVIGIKMIVRRRRPPGTEGMIYRKADPFSFPSGHAARAVLLSLLALRMGPSAAFVAIVLWSPLMVLSRIAIGIHYVLDVIAGAILGAFLTALVFFLAGVAGVRF